MIRTERDPSSTGPAGSGRMIDPRGHRFGAGVSAVLLAVGWLLGLPVVVPLVALALFVSAWFGTRYSILGRPWLPIRRALGIAPPKELEPEWPPRFAQAFGCVVLLVASVCFLLGLPTIGWIVAAMVAGLQTLLAVTGYCLGCRMYFLRWRAPFLFRRFAR